MSLMIQEEDAELVQFVPMHARIKNPSPHFSILNGFIIGSAGVSVVQD